MKAEISCPIADFTYFLFSVAMECNYTIAHTIKLLTKYISRIPIVSIFLNKKVASFEILLSLDGC